jgi:hypothetical protein
MTSAGQGREEPSPDASRAATSTNAARLFEMGALRIILAKVPEEEPVNYARPRSQWTYSGPFQFAVDASLGLINRDKRQKILVINLVFGLK